MISMIYKNNPQPLFSDVSPVISYVKENTKDGDVILSDRAEFAYLSQRRSLLNYIWGHKWFFTADGLINKLNESTLIVVAEENNYPTGFVDYLEKDYDVKEFNGGFKVFQKGYKKAYSNNRSITSISHLTQKIYLD